MSRKNAPIKYVFHQPFKNCLICIVKNNNRYYHVLEAVVSYTEELAYKQAREADALLAQGMYLGTSLFN